MAERTCSIDGCSKKAHARGWCGMHYQRWHKFGDTAYELPSLEERLWARVDKNGPVPEHRPDLGPCWVWTGARHRGRQHGQIGIEGRVLLWTHRVSWELFYGPIPGGLFVLHHCDNPPCVCPEHLWLGTQQDNVADMAAKGRGWWQRPNRGFKITDAQRDEIVAMYIAGGWTQRDIGERFGITKSAVSKYVVAARRA